MGGQLFKAYIISETFGESFEHIHRLVRMYEILDISPNTQGIVKANDVETSVTETIRKLAFETMR